MLTMLRFVGKAEPPPLDSPASLRSGFRWGGRLYLNLIWIIHGNKDIPKEKGMKSMRSGCPLMLRDKTPWGKLMLPWSGRRPENSTYQQCRAPE